MKQGDPALSLLGPSKGFRPALGPSVALYRQQNLASEFRLNQIKLKEADHRGPVVAKSISKWLVSMWSSLPGALRLISSGAPPPPP